MVVFLFQFSQQFLFFVKKWFVIERGKVEDGDGNVFLLVRTLLTAENKDLYCEIPNVKLK